MSPSAKDVLRRIDYTLFAAEATRAQIEKLCTEAREYFCQAVCVNGSRVELACSLLEESDVLVAALVGFPFGAGDSDAKRYEAEVAVDHGAHEIDVVINLGRLKDGDHQYVLRELRDIAEAVDERIVKVILETHLLTSDEKILACHLALDSGVKFVSTATDFYPCAPNLDEIKLLRETLGKSFGLKAAGRISDIQTAMKVIEAGVNRLGICCDLSSLGKILK